MNGTEVRLGCRVRVRDAWGDEEYTIVPRGEADIERGTISVASPVARTLLGRQQGEEVAVRTPGGIRTLTILRVDDPTLGCMETRGEPHPF